jgi:hypothetical protein
MGGGCGCDCRKCESDLSIGMLEVDAVLWLGRKEKNQECSDSLS